MDTPVISFIGAGKMAEALISGIIQSSRAVPDNIICCDVAADRLAYMSDRFGIRTSPSAVEVCRASTIIILAVKPQNMINVLDEIKEEVSAKHLIVSIAAGVPIARIREKLGITARVIRTMPNTPCLIGEGMTAVAPGPGVGPEDIDSALRIFSAVGTAVEISEEKINIVTALSGSGPAFFYAIAEAFVCAGEARGLSYEEALRLVAQTMRGAAAMVSTTGDSIESLISMVSSPGGTTIAGLQVLQDGTMKKTIDRTVEAAKNRADELSRGG